MLQHLKLTSDIHPQKPRSNTKLLIYVGWVVNNKIDVGILIFNFERIEYKNFRILIVHLKRVVPLKKLTIVWGRLLGLTAYYLP